jgi:hypothetical protein
MATRRTERPTPEGDLFSVTPIEATTDAGKPLPVAATSPPRYLLPKDLPGALARLDAREVEALLAAVVDEVKRRGRLTPPVAKSVAEAIGIGETRQKVLSASSHPDQQGTSRPGGGLTLGQANAVRAASAAGVKPSRIARQFGISESAVKKALTADARPRTR